MITTDTPEALTIHMQGRGPVRRGGHAHLCPECHERVACEETCTLEEDQIGDDGTPCGAIVACDRCSP